MTSWNNGYLRPRKPHFSQLILQEREAIRQSKLWIPTRFIREHGREILKNVKVEDPSGKTWYLEWSRSRGKIWFRKGWQEFADYYCLEHGHLLVFEYEGNSKFSVIILDRTSTEINYPIHITDENLRNAKNEEEYEVPFDDSIPNLSRKRKKSSAKWSSRPPKLKKKLLDGDSGGPGMEFKQKEILRSTKRKKSPWPSAGRQRPKKGRTSLSSSADDTKMSKDDENGEDFRRTYAATRTSVTPTSLKKSRAFRKIGLKSENLSFEVIMKHTHINGNFMTIPIKFARDHFKEESGNVILQTSEGKTWTVGYHYYRKLGYARLARGWPAFTRKNCLTTGVKCFFEIINHSELILKVVIVRANASYSKSWNVRGVHPCSTKLQSESSGKERRKQRLHGQNGKLSCKNVTKLIEKAEDEFMSLYPSFRVHIKCYHLQKGVAVPLEFMKHTGQQAEKELVFQLRVGEKSWPVKYVMYWQYNVRRFAAGWSVFARQNFLKVGDVCAFELVDTESMVLKTSIFRLDEFKLK